jgi:hypothetical protein
MVKDLPEAIDFFDSGKELLDFAWDITAKLLRDIDEADYFGIDPEEISDDYWSAAKSRLTTALSITQQGVEFILKGNICEISPYLLLRDPPSKWPSPYKDKEIKFSDFRVIDAQDLIRLIDTFADQPLEHSFVAQFHLLREKRNQIMHSIDKHIKITVTDVIESILSMHKALFPLERWPSIRLRFLRRAPDVQLGAYDICVNTVCWEVALVVGLLTPAKVKHLFGIDKKQRRYICPECLSSADHHIGLEHKLAVLSPKGNNSKNLYCPICDKSFKVLRDDCESCSSNVISQDRVCLTCQH